MRVAKDAYLAVQQIYYPGFTVAGLGEFGGLVATLALTAVLAEVGCVRYARRSPRALLLVTHPVNNFWLEDVALKGASKRFFAFGAGSGNGDWTALRDRWEYSHVARAAFAVLSLTLLAIAVTVPD